MAEKKPDTTAVPQGPVQAPNPHELPVTFGTFVISLASSAAFALGEAPHPDSGQIQRDLQLAKQTIDLLAMLQDKTRGNLDADEARLIESVLYDLRMRYVQASRT
jgi:hypothetical protein